VGACASGRLSAGDGAADTCLGSGRLRSYAETLITRDVRLLVDIERVADMARLLQLLAAQIGQLLNLANLLREMGMPHSALQRYLLLLETLMVVIRIPP